MYVGSEPTSTSDESSCLFHQPPIEQLRMYAYWPESVCMCVLV